MFNLGLLLIKLFLLLLVLIGSCFLEFIVVAGVISKLFVEEMDDLVTGGVEELSGVRNDQDGTIEAHDVLL